MKVYLNKGKKQFSDREKRAFSAGRGYAAGKKGKRVRLKNEKEVKSFLNGFNSAF